VNTYITILTAICSLLVKIYLHARKKGYRGAVKEVKEDWGRGREEGEGARERCGEKSLVRDLN
jgi:hypothetical protein